MMLDGFIQLLTGNAAVNALIAGRAYKNLLVKGYTLPALVVHRYGGNQEYQADGPAGVREDQIQVDCYAYDADVAQQVAEAVRAALVNYKGRLSDGTVVQACFLERDMDMPFMSKADTKGIANRSLLGFRVVSEVSS